jgi:hypothetical protein
MTTDPEYGEPTGQEPEYPMSEDAAQDAAEDTGGIDTGTENPDLHGQAEEVQESASGPGPGKTPSGG